MSKENDGYFHTGTEIRALRDEYVSFAQVKYDKNNNMITKTTGHLSKTEETYTHTQKNDILCVRYHKNADGEWVYEGTKGKLVNNTIIDEHPLSPKEAQREFNKLKKDVNKQVKNLSGQENLEAYGNQLKSSKPPLNLAALWNEIPTTESRTKAEKANEAVTQKYADMPAAIVAKNKNFSR